MPARSVAFFLAAVSGVLHAQSLTVSASAAAPVRNDSIYALRVDPAQYRGEDDVLLLDEGTFRVEADGRSAYTLRQVAQILTTDGVQNWGELSFWYKAGRQRVHVNWIRVIGPDGSLVHDGPAHEQEVRPSAKPGAPVFSDRRAVQVTLAGLAPGTLVDYSYTLETLQPAMPGDFLHYWYLNGGSAVRRSRFTFDAPADLNPLVEVRNLTGAPEDTVIGGRRIRRWNVADIPETVWQRYAGSPNDIIASVRVGGRVSWHAVGAWYESLARDRYQVTPEIVAAQAHELLDARTREDSLRATYRWVAQDFRYVSLSLGEGSYQPRLPREVFETRFGDCKDKTTLFVSLARRMGMVAYPVLVQSDGWIDTLLPSMKHFDHVIAAVELGGRTRYLDVTSPLTPYGELPPKLQGEPGLAVREGNIRVVVLPASAPEHNRYEEHVVGAFRRDGSFVGHITTSATGSVQYDLRDQLAGLTTKDKPARDETLRQFALSTYSTAVVDSAHYADGNDLSAPPTVTVWFTAARVLGQMGTKYYFNLSLSRFVGSDVLARLDAEGERVFPIDVASVNSPSVYRSSLEVQLPEGWQAELPHDVYVNGPFGYYRAEYRQAGRVFRASREMGGLRGLEPPDSIAALRAWLQAVADDRTTMIVLDRGTGADLVAGAGDGVTGATGALPDVVLGQGDLSAHAQMTQEGQADASSGFLFTLSSSRPLESYQRDFDAEQMVFPLGSSQLASLQVSAAAFRTAAEARRPLEFLRMMDLEPVLKAVFGLVGNHQISIGALHPVAMDSIGDRAAGWTFEFITPMATLDMMVLLEARGRVGTSIIAVGLKGMQSGDVVALLRLMDDRIRAHDAYLADLDAAGDSDEVAAADSALLAATHVALNAVPVPLPDTAAMTIRKAVFTRENGWPQFRLGVMGKGLTFPVGTSHAFAVTMKVTLHDTEAQAFETVVAAERDDRAHIVRSIMGNMGALSGFSDALAGGDSTIIDAVAAPRIGALSHVTRARLRGAMPMDVDAVVFARGRLSAAVIVNWPPGKGDSAAALAIAQEMLQRMRNVAGGGTESPPPRRLLTALARVVDAERTVDSLVDAREVEAAFRTVERAELKRAPVGFAASTWNSLCWWASLEGQAKRASAACEAAVAPDTTVLAYRDSRGLERALVGDLDGARSDFAYVVANAARGDFYDMRAAWLSALRAGQNPFTPEVLAKLRED